VHISISFQAQFAVLLLPLPAGRIGRHCRTAGKSDRRREPAASSHLEVRSHGAGGRALGWSIDREENKQAGQPSIWMSGMTEKPLGENHSGESLWLEQTAPDGVAN